MKIRKRKIVILAGFLLLSCGAVLHWYWLDGIKGAAWELFLGCTEYSPYYGEWKFRRIRKGMAEEEVFSILREPLFKRSFENDRQSWFYSYGKRQDSSSMNTDSCFTSRIVKFQDGKVFEVKHEFYFD